MHTRIHTPRYLTTVPLAASLSKLESCGWESQNISEMSLKRSKNERGDNFMDWMHKSTLEPVTNLFKDRIESERPRGRRRTMVVKEIKNGGTFIKMKRSAESGQA